MAQVYKPPHNYIKDSNPVLFLAGTIENGKAGNWAEIITESLSNKAVSILNPRRDDWDPTLQQSITDSTFKSQVEWELNGLTSSDVIAMYFEPNTVSPITLLEFGMWVKSGKLVVASPQGFWRRGNLEVTCAKYNVLLLDSLDHLILELHKRIP